MDDNEIDYDLDNMNGEKSSIIWFIIYIALLITCFTLVGLTIQNAGDSKGVQWTLYALGIIASLIGVITLWFIDSLPKWLVSVLMLLGSMFTYIALLMSYAPDGNNKGLFVGANVASILSFLFGTVNLIMY